MSQRMVFIMSMYDRDWYREAYKEKERRNNSGKRSGGSSPAGMVPFVFILLFIIVIGHFTGLAVGLVCGFCIVTGII